eukprot:2509590-Pyramimonas_sp.AAC.1
MLSLAARSRVARHEAGNEGGLQTARRARELRRAMADSDFVLRQATWHGWFNSAMILHLDDAVSHYDWLGWTASR